MYLPCSTFPSDSIAFSLLLYSENRIRLFFADEATEGKRLFKASYYCDLISACRNIVEYSYKAHSIPDL